MGPLLLLAVLFVSVFILVPIFLLGVALVSLVEAPSQLLYLIRNPQVRKNHALEHATINLLQADYGLRLSGMSYPDRFVVFGVADPYAVMAAAQRAKQLLGQGRTDLVVHPRCGTTAVLTAFFFAVLFILLSWILGLFSWINILLAVTLAWAVGSTVSPWVQKHVTTDARVGDLDILGADYAYYWAFPAGVVVYTKESNVRWAIR
ncbi:hypothetical protein HPY42_02005 [Coprothermobacteraceae bacterium]|nr:hypothetical protein [Coprothermobacteraceae bacterium]